ncbi:unnamed protein product [Coregonus sp. 'balchen']|nr:unnamed protein product [Coregonus sp. 'balchen']
MLGLWCVGARLGILTLVLCCTLAPLPAHAYIYAHYSNMTNMLFEDLSALFGSSLPKEGLMGVLVESRPLNGCTPIKPPPSRPTSSDPNTTTTKYIVLIRRYDCNFDIKVLHAQQAGFSAAIVHNMYSETLLNMNYSNETIAEEIEIPSVFTSYYASQILRTFIIPEQGAYVILKPEFAFPLSYYLIPFTGVVGMIILVMVVFLFQAYHSKCVDPWLTGTKKTCPVCKQRVTRPNPEYSESESEDERASGRDEEGGEGEADTERTPLLRPSNPGFPSGNPGAYSATVTTVTTAQCLGSPTHYDSPILEYEGYYSPQEESDSDTEEGGVDSHPSDDDTAQLIGRGTVGV